MVYTTAYPQHLQQQRINRSYQGINAGPHQVAPQSHPWSHQASRSFSAGSIYYPPRAASPSPSRVAGYHPRSRSVSGTESLRSASIPVLNMSSTGAGPSASVPDRYHRHRPSLRSSPSVKSFDFDSTSTQTSNSSSTGSLPEDDSKTANIQQVREIFTKHANSLPDLTKLTARSRSNSPSKLQIAKQTTPPSPGRMPATAFAPIQPKWAAPSPPPQPADAAAPADQPTPRRGSAKQAPLVLPSDVRVRNSMIVMNDERRRQSVVRPDGPSGTPPPTAPATQRQPAQRSASVEALRGPSLVAKAPTRPRSENSNRHMLTPEVSPTNTQQMRDRAAETHSLPPARAAPAMARPVSVARPASVMTVESKVTASAPEPARLKKSRSIGSRLRSLFGSKTESKPAASPAAKPTAATQSVRPAQQRSAQPSGSHSRALSSSRSMYDMKDRDDAASVTSVKSTLSMTSMRRMFKRKDRKLQASPSFEVLTPPMTRQEQQQHHDSQQRQHVRQSSRVSVSQIDYAPRSYRNSMSVNRPVSTASISSIEPSGAIAHHSSGSINGGTSSASGSKTSLVQPRQHSVASSHSRPVSTAFGDALSPGSPDVSIFSEFEAPANTSIENTGAEGVSPAGSRPPTPLPTLLSKRELESDEQAPDLAASSTVFPRSLDEEAVANIKASLEPASLHDGKLSRKSSRRSAKSPKEREEKSVPNAEEVYLGTAADELANLDLFSFPSAADSLELNHPAFKPPAFSPPIQVAPVAPLVPGAAFAQQGSKSSRPYRRHKVSFSSRIIVFDTYAESDYDRKPEEATCHRLTASLAQQIKQELNSFKLQMDVHEQSRVYTHFF